MDDEKPALALPLHPYLSAECASRRARPPYRALGVAEVRRIFSEGQTAGTRGPDIASVLDGNLAIGACAIPVRLYRPGAATAPLIVYFHGGGFTLGDLDTHDRNCRDLAVATGATVVSVGYRLAPEHPFPAAVDDALTAVRHILLNAAGFATTPDRVLVAGDSAGATLAFVVALALRDAHGPKLAGIVTYYPGVDFSRAASPSYEAFGDGSYGLSVDDTDWFRDQYTPNPADRLDWRCSPALADDLSGLPPTLIVAAAYDVLR